MLASERRSARSRRRVGAVFILLLVLFDGSFDRYFWRIPRLGDVWTFWGYQFLYDLRRLELLPPGKERTRVVAFGSSASVSFDRFQVEGLVERAEPGTDLEVQRLLVAGIKPSDYRLLFAAEAGRIRPDIVVALLNVSDFLNPSFEAALKQHVRYLLPPWLTLRERWRNMPGLSSKLDVALGGLSRFYRYRNVIRAALQDHGRFLWQRLRDRGGRPPYGVFDDGYTEARFGLPIPTSRQVNLEYFIAPQWIAQRGRVRLELRVGRTLVAERIEVQPGWKRIELRLPEGGSVLHVEADGTWVPRSSDPASDDVRLLAVKLRDPPREAMRRGRPPLRYPPVTRRQRREILRMHGARGEEFVRLWQKEVDSDTPFGRRVRGEFAVKTGIAQLQFDGGGEYAAFEETVRQFSAAGVPVVIATAPDSPLISKYFRDSSYYRSHIAFLAGLAEKYPRVRFYDLTDVLPFEDFNDWHHVNYVGTAKLGLRYAEMVRAAMRDLPPRQP